MHIVNPNQVGRVLIDVMGSEFYIGPLSDDLVLSLVGIGNLQCSLPIRFINQ